MVSVIHVPSSQSFPIAGPQPSDSKFNFNSIYALIFDFWGRGETHSPLIGELNMFFMFFTQIQTQNKFPDFNLQQKYSKSFLSLDTTPNYANDLSLESSRKALSNSTMIVEK